ncbi:GNAT family N-acetyltransferase [Aminipila terrae]|uniref:GNAT family N-acetyltransferase n=1 Tax=Aminipila terrae TaxID=2697030 RepID=UPI001FADCDBF|nr:GNAT family N-acetyltransferase [Aminipila terrae]
MIRKAVPEDVVIIEQIYNEILEKEEKTISYTNWQKGLYPTIKTAQNALEAGTLFVGEEEDKTLYGCVVLNHIQPKEYKNISWNIDHVNENEVLVIHTLCIRPLNAGQGRGNEFVAFAEKHGNEIGCKVIRLDTYEKNTPAARLYGKLGIHM